MSQTVPATAVLGPGATGLTIGYRVLNLDGTEYSAFTTTGVAETSTDGTYRVAGGVVAPDDGGYIVFGTALVDYAEATVESTAVNVTLWKDATAPAMTGDAYAVVTNATYGLDKLARTGADGDTLETLSDQIDGVGGATGSGAVSFPVTINDEGGDPIDGVEVWISTDSAGASVVAGTLSTDALGVATFMLDAGTYYLWRQKSGYNFTNPVTIVVS